MNGEGITRDVYYFGFGDLFFESLTSCCGIGVRSIFYHQALYDLLSM